MSLATAKTLFGKVTSSLHRPLAGLLAGFALGFVAWGSGRSPAAAALLPMMLAFGYSRRQAFLVGFGYAMATLRHVPVFVGSWFDNSLVAGSLALLAYCVISGSIWSLGWSASEKPWRKSMAVVVSWVLAQVPPFAMAVPGHPMLAWGVIAAGYGWMGVLASVAVPVTIVSFFSSIKLEQRFRWGMVGNLSVLLAVIGLISHQPATHQAEGAIGVSTNWGKFTEETEEVVQRIEDMGRFASLTQDADNTTVFWPESILGAYQNAYTPLLDRELLSTASKRGQTHVIGVDLGIKERRYASAAVALFPDGSGAVAKARQPAPISLWKPWAERDTFIADWTHNNIIDLGKGRRAAVIFCYEEYMPLLYLINEWRDKPGLYVAMTNTWAEPNQEGADIQTQHSLSMARLFGRPYVKAENRPLPRSAQKS